jgi:hypothetical protein
MIVLPLVAGGVFMQAARTLALATAVIALLCGPAQTQTPESALEEAAISEPAAAPASVTIPAGTALEVELTEALSSETSQQEQLFGLRLAAPIIIEGREVVPAGALGGGEVIDAAPSAFGGRQGRLIISGRFIEIAGQRARIRSMQISVAGESRSATAAVTGALIGIPAFLIQGGEIRMPVGTRATARLANDTVVPLSPAPIAEQPALQAQ